MTNDQLRSLINRLANDAPISVDGVEPLSSQAHKTILLDMTHPSAGYAWTYWHDIIQASILWPPYRLFSD